MWRARLSSSPAAGQNRGEPEAEDARASAWRRYIGNWSTAEHGAESATLSAEFQFPAGGKPYLSPSVPESAWAKEPWDYAKAYLLVLLKDENRPTDDNWVSADLAIKAMVNGVAKPVYAYRTGRRQEKGLTRCYFLSVERETQPGATNEVKVTLPIQRGLVFSGAYLDLPDQVPLGKPPE
jgi:hypothetical protein